MGAAASTESAQLSKFGKTQLQTNSHHSDHWVWWVPQHYQNCCKCISSLCACKFQWATEISQLLMTTWRYNPPTGADFEHAGLWSLMFCDRAQEEPIYDLVLCSFALHLLVTWLQWSMGTITLSSQASLVSRIETWHDFFFQRWVNQRKCISPLDVTTSFLQGVLWLHIHMPIQDRSWITCTLSSLARRAQFLMVATPHKRPVIEKRFGILFALDARSFWGGGK